MLEGCVQPSMSPNINAATRRVLDAAGIQTLTAPKAGCCGAVKFHLNDQDGGKAHMRTNIDAWWPLVETGEVEAIVMNASGCGVTVKEYGHILQDDPQYAEKAKKISDLTKDLSELLPDLVQSLLSVRPELVEGIKAKYAQQVAFHPPCTLQHGQQLRGGVEKHLGDLGFKINVASCEAHLCCGSAGTYSVLQPEIAYQLRDRKLGNLNEMNPEVIVSANIGCITHLQSGTPTPVKHWVELLDAALI
jgi:glycolate oxidase iron-sulfur subunit